MYTDFNFKCEKHTIRSSYVDINQEMTISAICEIIQELAGDDAREQGFGYETIVAHNLFWVMSRIKIEIDKLPVWKDEVFVYTWVRSVDKFFSIRDFHFLDVDGQSLVRVSTLWAMIDANTRRPQLISKFVDFPNLYPNVKAIDGMPEKTPNGLNYIDVQNISVRYGDLDIAQHVNNIRYTDWVFDSFNLDIHKNYVVSNYLVNFVTEATAEHTLVVRVDNQPDMSSSIVRILRENDDKLVCTAMIDWCRRP